MAARTSSRSRRVVVTPPARRLPPAFYRFWYHLPGWLMLAAALVVLVPHVLGLTVSAVHQVFTDAPAWFQRTFVPTTIAPLFTPEVRRWGPDIERWAAAYALDPDLLATVMQIESCGHPTISSSAGARGLFQVMPFHFSSGEDPLDPDTNARRGAAFLRYCADFVGGDSGLALACYNGGPGAVSRPYASWSAETQRYYHWGTGIYADASAGSATSSTLDRWLSAGGAQLCQWAAEVPR